MTKPAPTRGRPEHKASQKNHDRVCVLIGLGWNNKRVANALNVDLKTLRKHYPELKFRDGSRDRLDAMMAAKLWEMFMGGNVAAGRELRLLAERNDRLYGQPAPLSPKLGKKEQALRDAKNPDVTSPMGRLLMERAARYRAEAEDGQPH